MILLRSCSFVSIRDWIDSKFIAHALNIYLLFRAIESTNGGCRLIPHSENRNRVWSFTLWNFSVFCNPRPLWFLYVLALPQRTEKRVDLLHYQQTVYLIKRSPMHRSDAARSCFTSLYVILSISFLLHFTATSSSIADAMTQKREAFLNDSVTLRDLLEIRRIFSWTIFNRLMRFPSVFLKKPQSLLPFVFMMDSL